MKNKKKKDIILKALYILVLFIITLILVASIFSKVEFSGETFEEYVFYAFNGIGSSDFSMTLYAIKKYGLLFVIILFVLIALTHKITKKEYKYYPIKPILRHRGVFLASAVVVSIVLSLNNVSFFSYIHNNIAKSNLIKKEYQTIDYDDVKFENKKNLIIIYVESLETTFLSKEHGGAWDNELLPELYNLMNDDGSIYFATDNDKRGIYNTYGTSWTTASVISSTAGIPFKIPFEQSKFDEKHYLRKVITLGDILKNQGYYNEVISGANTKFGALYDYFKIHGDYNIIDPETVSKYDIDVSYDTKGPWGFNDKYMFDLAKDRITKLASQNQPFNEIIIGIDSHPVNGFRASYTVDKFNKQYENVYATESILVSEFIYWLKEQDFYNDTTVIIVGDHLCMQTTFMQGVKLKDRGRFNLFINSSVNTDNTKNRGIASYDLYPTIVAAMGADIKNNQIGLGVNLFSDKKTLIEKYGKNKLDKELEKKSLFYNDLMKE